MVAGGTTTLTGLNPTVAGTLSSVEIYDPTTGTWSPGPSLGGARLAPALTSLPNTDMMVTGGIEIGFFGPQPASAVSTTAVEFYSLAANSWSPGPSMNGGRGGHVYNTVTLLDGRILLTGGQLVSSIQTMANAPVTATVDIYDPVSNSWTASSMISARAQHAATVLADGRVVVTGGAQGSLGAPTPIAGVELFDPVTNTWTAQPNLLTPRSGHVAHLQPDGLLVLFGGRAAAPLASISTLHF